MDKKTLTAIFLSILVMIFWNVWYFQRYGDVIEANKAKNLAKVETPAQPSATTTPKKEVSEPDKFDEKDVEDIFGSAPAVVTPLDPTASLMGATAEETGSHVAGEKTTIVDTGYALVTLSNIGGVVTSWKLTKFGDDAGNPIELIKQDFDIKPLSLEFTSAEATKKINRTAFELNAPGKIVLTDRKQNAAVIFTHKLDTGFEIKKKIVFHYNSHRADVDISLSHSGASVTGSAFGVGWYGLGDVKDKMMSYDGPVILVDGKRLTKKPDEDEENIYEGQIEWAGLTNRYYCIAFFPEDRKAKMTQRQVGEDVYSNSLQLVSQGSGKPISFYIYAGPKMVSELKKQERGFQKMINYGWFDVIAKPIYRIMVWLHDFVFHNFGWAIIVITIALKLLFYPLTQKSFQSMSKMRKLQPQMKIIQERYKSDKAKMNEELMLLYRKHKVNPLAGCLPIFLQIPVFIALYKVLLESIELKGAEFIFWIHDLSLKDPYYVTPLLMGLSMFIQQKLSPQANDPVQRNLMMLMPVVFTVMFINFPSGLVIYWLVNNILSIAQQWHVNRSAEEA